MGIPGMAGCEMRGAGCGIGPCVTLTEFAAHRDIRRHYSAVARAAELVSTPLLRNMGTLGGARDRKSTRLNSSHVRISYAVFCLKKKKLQHHHEYYLNAVQCTMDS